MKVAVGISGGVDSAVTVLKLKALGYEVVGLTMALGRTDDATTILEAQTAAASLQIPLTICDFAEAWRSQVLDYIKATYLLGKTPNPCVRCNERVKMALLPQFAFESLKCDCFATGHYARVKAGRLFRAIDHAKDQSYFLYRVPKTILERTLFPLGEMTKSEVRAVAKANGLAIAEKGDSQDFCGGDPMAIVGATPKLGNVVTMDGKVIGKHNGFWNFTVGKRKGIGIGGGIPYYVVALRPESNEVVVGYKEAAVSYDLKLVDTIGTIDKSLPVKVRSAGEPKLLVDGIVGVAPGQSAVFFDGDEVVGGGIIA